MKQTTKALFIELSEPEHRAIRMASALRGQTLREFVMAALAASIGELAPGDRRIPTPAGEEVTGDGRT